MKRLLLFFLSSAMLFSCSDEYDDSGLWNSVNSLEERVAQLEQLCKQMNTNISSLQTLVTALQNYDCITSIVPVIQNNKEIGYTITFTKSDPITIYHGKDGEKGETGATGQNGHTPVIGVKQDTDGVYYWTLDGEWLTDGGNKIKAQGTDGTNGESAYELAVEKGYEGTLEEWLESLKGNNGISGNDGKSAYELAVEKGYSGTLDEWLADLQGDVGPEGDSGITPQLKIENGYWNVSYDNGNSWTQLGKATGEDGQPGSDSMFQDIDYETSSDYVVFTLKDGTNIYIPRYKRLSIYFSEGSLLTFLSEETQTIHYTVLITSKVDNIVVKAEMLNDDGSYTLRTIPTSETQGTIEITAVTPTVNKVIVTVSDGSNTILSDIDVIIKPSFDGQTVTVATPGTLASLLADYDQTTITELKVIGSLNIQDCYILAELPNLSVLDMEQVNMEKFPGNPGGHPFFNNKTLTEIKLPKNLKIIEPEAFYGCSNLTSVTIPESVTEIEERAFMHCSSLTSVTIPESITEIGEGVFHNCSNLEAFYGKYASEDNRTLIKDGKLLAFAPADLLNYSIPQGVTSIGNSAFSYSSLLMNITIPEGVTTIGDGTFSGCTSLTRITIPEGVKSIGKEAFKFCDDLTEIIIPEGVTIIGERTFSECRRLTSITIPKSVTSIGEYAFVFCSSLTNIIIPESVTSIGEGAFYCSSLANITISEGLTTIGENAFQNSSLTEITIPQSVSSIGLNAFNSSNLTKLYCKSSTPPQVGGTLGLISSCVLYVPTGSTEAYRSTEGWNYMTFKEIIEMDF